VTVVRAFGWKWGRGRRTEKACVQSAFLVITDWNHQIFSSIIIIILVHRKFCGIIKWPICKTSQWWKLWCLKLLDLLSGGVCVEERTAKYLQNIEKANKIYVVKSLFFIIFRNLKDVFYVINNLQFNCLIWKQCINCIFVFCNFSQGKKRKLGKHSNLLIWGLWAS
jgi:hypothetical protein